MPDTDVSERLQSLESHTAGLDARLSGVERTLTTHGAKLDRIVDALARTSAQPRFDPVVIVGFIKDIAILFGLVCAGIIYVAAAQTGVTTAVLEHRVGVLESRGPK
jgi:hypothetical protein